MTRPDPIRNSEHAEHLPELGVRSGVRIETNSKGMAQVKVSVYAGETVEEMERIMELAVKVYEKTLQNLGSRAEF